MRLDGISTWLVALGLAALLAWIQFDEPALVAGDSYFHARAAQQLAEHGVLEQFPQAFYSTWAERYSDKDFLFHVLLIPFCAGPLPIVTGAKLAVIALDLAILLVFIAVARRTGARVVWLWLLLLFGSHAWLWLHLEQVRPHLLGLVWLLIEIGCVLTGRRLALGVATAAHVWSHTSFLLVPALVFARFAARYWRDRQLEWGDAAAVAVGVGAAFLLHPYFPNNLELTWDQVVEVARSLWWERPALPADLFGAELGRMSAVIFFRSGLLWVPVLIAAGLRFASRDEPPSVDVLTLMLFSVMLWVLSAFSMRFLVFFLPVCGLTGALLATQVAVAARFGERAHSRRPLVVAVALVLALALSLGPVAQSAADTRRRTRAAQTVEDARDAVAFLDRVAAPSDVVFHAHWTPFAALYFHRPNGRYIHALDPIFLYRADPQRFAGMLAVYRGTAEDPFAVISGDFAARWIYLPKLRAFNDMLGPLFLEPRIRAVYSDDSAIVFRVDAPEPGPAQAGGAP